MPLSTRFFQTAALLSILLLLPAGVGAAAITLRTRADCTVENARAHLTLTISNLGDATARALTAAVRPPAGNAEETLSAGDLPPGATTTIELRAGLPPAAVAPPIVVTITYRHDNGLMGGQNLVVETGGAETDRTDTITAVRTHENLIEVSIEAAGITTARLEAVVPAGMRLAPPPGAIALTNGAYHGRFTLTAAGNGRYAIPDRFPVYWIASYQRPDGHTAYLTTALEWQPPSSPASRPSPWRWGPTAAGALAALVLAIAGSHRRRRLGTVLTLTAVTWSLAAIFPWEAIRTPTIATGGDMASHYHTFDYLLTHLLPHGRISGWDMGNYAGFPLLQFYFPLPFLVMAALKLVMAPAIAFKLVTVAGIFLLPVCALLMMRDLDLPSPAPALAAAMSVLFLLHTGNSMWGGNLLSTLAGEFSYTIGMALSLLLTAGLFRGARDNSRLGTNAVLVFLTGFAHGYPLLFAEAASLYLIIAAPRPLERAFYLFKVYALGFLLLAFWLVPLLFFAPYTTPYHTIWTISSWHQLVPPLLLPPAVAAVASLPLLCLRRLRPDRPALLYLWWQGGIAAVLYFIGPAIGLVDIRFFPFAQLMACLIPAAVLGALVRARPRRFLPETMVIALCLAAAATHSGTAAAWARWNYQGFQGKKAWPLFTQINAALRGGVNDPRVAYENTTLHNDFGTPRAFESLPLFAGRSTLEGLYMQASPSAPFVFYLQSLISKDSSRPFPQYHYDRMDFARARPRLALFNVNELIVRTGEAKAAIAKAGGYHKKSTHGPYEIWESADAGDSYVWPVRYQPVVYTGGAYKEAAFKWFCRDDALDLPVILPTAGRRPPRQFATVTDLTGPLPKIPIAGDCRADATLTDHQIDITTNCRRPLMVSVSYHPNWRARGAELFQAAPALMLIIPHQDHVRLTYGPGKMDAFGALLSLAGLVILGLRLVPAGRRAMDRLTMPALSPRGQRLLCLALALILAAGAMHAKGLLKQNPQRLFAAANAAKDAGLYQKARQDYKRVIAALPLSDMAREARYGIAACYYLEGDMAQAAAWFNRIIEEDAHSPWRAAAFYHLGKIALQRHDRDRARQYLRVVRDRYPESGVAAAATATLKALGDP